MITRKFQEESYGLFQGRELFSFKTPSNLVSLSGRISSLTNRKEIKSAFRIRKI
jgi:hypothetical protein